MTVFYLTLMRILSPQNFPSERRLSKWWWRARINTANYIESVHWSYTIQRKWGKASRWSALWTILVEIGHDIWREFAKHVTCKVIGHSPVFKMYDTYCKRCGIGTPMGGRIAAQRTWLGKS